MRPLWTFQPPQSHSRCHMKQNCCSTCLRIVKNYSLWFWAITSCGSYLYNSWWLKQYPKSFSSHHSWGFLEPLGSGEQLKKEDSLKNLLKSFTCMQAEWIYDFFKMFFVCPWNWLCLETTKALEFSLEVKHLFSCLLIGCEIFNKTCKLCSQQQTWASSMVLLGI